nr:MAG TPA: major capsid protein [Caudoviricetes sp.]
MPSNMTQGSQSADLTKAEREQMTKKLQQAMESGDEAQAAQAMAEFGEMIQQAVISEAQAAAVGAVADSNILAARGVRQLTSTETKYWEKVIAALRSDDYRQALSSIEIAMPETTIDSVFDDLVQQHPILDAIGFINTNGKVKMIVNKGGIQLAVWGPLTGAFKTELEGSIDEIDTGMYKLQAFIPVSKAMLDLGPAWLDKYVRTILSEALAFGMEKAIICGTGKDEPVGINRVVGKNAVITAGVYSEKKAIKVPDFSPATYGELCSKLATNSESGLARTVSDLIMVVNPVDYLKIIMPATTIMSPDGRYINNVLPVPTKIVQSPECPQGKAYLGIGKRYFLALGTSKGGKIEYDDSAQFMQDNRVYAIRLYGNGMPLDNNAFITLDISKLAALHYSVTTLAETAETDTPASGGTDDSKGGT